MNFPFVIFLVSLAGLWISGWLGTSFRKALRPVEDHEWLDFSILIGALLTLLGLLIGFSFSMAVSRYDQRKNYEEEEANAIGTEYLRAQLLPAEDALVVRQLLRKYLEERQLFYMARDDRQLAQINSDTARLEHDMWSRVLSSATAQPTPTVALAVSGMNDVLNREGYTQAAWLNRIPLSAWVLIFTIALGSNLLIGYASHKGDTIVFWVLPLAVAISFFLIADVESPRYGLIRVQPKNLISLSQSLSTP